MKTLKTFEQFNSINEGNWFKRTFKPEEFDSQIKKLISGIKYNFDINKLTYDKYRGSYTYHHVHPPFNKVIKITINSSRIYIDDENISRYVDKHYIRELYNFFKEKYQNKEKEIQDKDSKDFKNRISKKLSFLDEDDDVFLI